MKTSHLILLVASILLGIALIFVRTDRQTIHLIPTPGAANTIPANANDTYEFTFRTNLSRITRVGFYVTPLEKSIPAADLSLRIYRGTTLVGESIISSTFIDQERPIEWRFSPPLKTFSRESLSATITIPPELSGKVGLKVRIPDGTFITEDTLLTINNQPQPAPLAYEVYTAYIPPLAPQLGSLMVMGALVILGTSKTKKHIGATHLLLISFILSTIATLPTLLLGGNPLLLIIIQATAWYLMVTCLRLKNHSLAASMTGASIFAFTSWFALQVAGDRSIYTLFSLLPLIPMWRFRNSFSFQQRMYIGIVVIAVLVMAVMNLASLNNQLPSVPASLRDTLFDPNQLPIIVKTTDNALWHHFGSYIGLIAGTLSLIGLLSSYRQKGIVISLVAIGLIVFTPLAYTLPLPISPAHLSIIVVFFLSQLAASGLDRLRLFLGAKDAIVTSILIAIAGIIILDLWQVMTPILELPYLT